MNKLHEKRCCEIIRELEDALALIRRVKGCDAHAAVELMTLCSRLPYEGCVLQIRLDSIVAYCLESDGEGE